MATSSSGQTICQNCGTPLPVNATEGLCPRCVFGHLEPGPAASDQTFTATIATEAAADAIHSEAASRSRDRFGEYELLEEIARGGMGVVYKARQVSLDRIVAVKMILAGAFAGKELTQRFRGEASAAALLQHPNIVAVHEVGVHQGRHYFSMDYVQGQNLAQLVGNRPLAGAQAARYIQSIARAIHYAHEQGILHRDLKPTNVLVDAATDQPRVTDFGLAKRLGGESSLTLSGQVLGSPHFLPPEQASGSRWKVGRQSDVFGLGSILYYLLTARAPFQGETLEMIIDQVLHVEPVAPRLLNPGVSLDLETVCLKCLEKEPERRYATAAEVAEELDRVLKDQPIVARPVGRVEKGWRWCRRNPGLASVSALSLMLLAAVFVTAVIGAIVVAAGHRKLEENLYFNRVALAYREIVANRPAHACELLEACPVKLRDWEWQYLYRRCYRPGFESKGTSGPVYSLAISPNGHDVAVIAGQQDHEALTLSQLTPEGEITRGAFIAGASHMVLESVASPGWVAFSSNGRFLAAVNTNMTVTIRDLVSETVVQTLQGHSKLISAIAFRPNTTELATGSFDGSVRIWDAASGMQRFKLEVGSSNRWAGSVAYSPDGRWLAAGTFGSNVVRMWGASEGNLAFELADHSGPVACLAFTSDSAYLASGSADHSVRVWDISARRTVAILKNTAFVSQVAFNPSGTRLFSAGADREVKVWDWRSERQVLSLAGNSNHVTSLAFDPAGCRLVSGGYDGVLRIWDASPSPQQALRESRVLRSHRNRVWGLDFAPNGELFSASEDGTGVAWDLLRGLPVRQFETFFDVRVSVDGQYVITMGPVPQGAGHYGRILDYRSLQTRFEVFQDREIMFALSPNGEFLVGGGSERQVSVWDWRNPEHGTNGVPLATLDASVVDLRFSRNGRYLASLSEDGVVKAWDATRLGELWRSHNSGTTLDGKIVLPKTALRDVAFIAFSADGQRLASGDGFNDVVVVDVETGALALPKLKGHGDIVLCVAFSPDGRFLASGGMDKTVRLWDAKTGQYLRQFLGHSDVIYTLAFSPDSSQLASGSHDRSIRVWPLAGGPSVFSQSNQ